jgi:hypothetical protein
MKSAPLILLFYCLFLFGIHAESASPTGNPLPAWHKLTVGIYPAAPFNMRQADGSWTGISVDLWREIASDLKVDFEFKEIPVADRFNALMNGWIDVCIGPITVTAEREEQIDFTHRFSPLGCGSRCGQRMLLLSLKQVLTRAPLATLAQKPRGGFFTPSFRQTFARPTSDRPNSFATVLVAFDQTKS